MNLRVFAKLVVMVMGVHRLRDAIDYQNGVKFDFICRMLVLLGKRARNTFDRVLIALVGTICKDMESRVGRPERSHRLCALRAIT